MNEFISIGIWLPLPTGEGGKGGRHLLLFLLLFFASCTDRLSDAETPEPDVYATLSVSVPGSGLPQTRMTDAQQSAIKDLRVLVFDTGGLYRYTAPIASLSGSTITVRLLSSTGSEAYQLVLVANAPAPMAEPAWDEPKESVLKKFVIACTGVWKYGASDAVPLPMLGETNAVVVGDGTVFKDKDNSNSAVQMLRALARVDVGMNFTAVNNPNTNTATGLDYFKLKSVRMYNSKNKAYIYTNDPTTPNLPSSVSGWGNNTPNPLVYMPTAEETAAHAYCGNIFVPEAAMGASAGDVTATFLVIGGYYGAGNTTTETFYRIDFSNSGAMLALLRNHLYRVNITQVSSAGFATAEEAMRSKPADLTVAVTTWNYSAMNDMATDGQSYFSVSTKTPKLPYPAGGAVNVPVASNIPASEWVLTNPSSKLTVTKPVDATPQGGNLTFTAAGTGGTADGLAASDTVSVTLKARNMTMTFTVSQLQEENLLVSGAPGVNESGSGGEWTGSVSLKKSFSGANCFIVPIAGNWKLDASIKGNGKQVALPANLASDAVGTAVPATAAEVNITGGASAAVLWETTNTPTAPAEGAIICNVSYDAVTKQISFTTTGHEGNALIALKDASGTILWSWHIWRTNEPPVTIPLAAITATDGTVLATEGELKLMDRNLGALSAVPQSDLSTGLLYQWGRKDPFAGAATLSTPITSMAFNRVNNGSDAAWPAALLAEGGNSMVPADMVKNPTVCYTGASLGIRNDNLWGTPLTVNAIVNNGSSDYTYNINKGYKTIYDPCPVGWRVGPGYTFANAAKGSLTFTKGYSLPIGKNNAAIWFPASGLRMFNNATLREVGFWGYYQSSMPLSAYSFHFKFSNSIVIPGEYINRTYNMAVRCVVE